MKHDRHTIIKWISNALLALGAFIGAITLIGTYRLARELQREPARIHPRAGPCFIWRSSCVSQR
jgi:hypothetical protein